MYVRSVKRTKYLQYILCLFCAIEKNSSYSEFSQISGYQKVYFPVLLSLSESFRTEICFYVEGPFEIGFVLFCKPQTFLRTYRLT